MRLIETFVQLCGKYTIIGLICLQVLLSTMNTINAEEASAARYISQDQGGALSITSSKMTLETQENTILFEGDVVLERDSMMLKARSVEVMFTPLSEDDQGLVETIENKRKLSRITASGEVRLLHGGRTVTSDKVVYYKNEEKMVFTGSPSVMEGQNELKGDKITIYIQEDRVVVEGGAAVIHPR